MQEAMLDQKIFTKQFGRDMRNARLKHGMSQSDLAVKMQLFGVDVSTDRIRKIEKGVYKVTGQEMLVISFVLILDLREKMLDYVAAYSA